MNESFFLSFFLSLESLHCCCIVVALLLQTIGLEFCLLGKCQKSVVELVVGAAAGWLAGWCCMSDSFFAPEIFGFCLVLDA